MKRWKISISSSSFCHRRLDLVLKLSKIKDIIKICYLLKDIVILMSHDDCLTLKSFEIAEKHFWQRHFTHGGANIS